MAKNKNVAPGPVWLAHRAWRRVGWCALALLGVPGCHRAATRAPLAHAGGVTILSGYAYPTVDNAGAAYLALRGTAASPDTLLGVSTLEGGSGMLMGTSNGQMTTVSVLEIPPGGDVRMHPGAMHLMFEGLQRSYGIGDSLELRLHFARAGEVIIRVPVVAYGEMPE